jgi:lysyl-tRNA synthetase class 2
VTGPPGPGDAAAIPVPYRFERDASAADLHARHPDLLPGTETGDVVSVAGRLMLRRVQGKVAFGTLVDSSGRVQLFARVDVTPRFQEFCDLNLGDWLGVTGEVITTRRGELSVRVDEWVVLAATRRQFPDKWQAWSTSTPGTASATWTCGRPTTPAAPSSCAAGW